MSIKIVKYGVRELEKEFGPLTFGRLLSSFRLGEEWTQGEMAQVLRISKQSLCDLEKGRRIPTPGRAASIARKLKMHEGSFVQLALQDELKRENLDLFVHISETKSAKIS